MFVCLFSTFNYYFHLSILTNIIVKCMSSCGVFIMKYMENIVQDKCCQMDFTADDIKYIRSEIAEWFFQASKSCQ